jgi:hypothetical protein
MEADHMLSFRHDHGRDRGGVRRFPDPRRLEVSLEKDGAGQAHRVEHV